MSLEGKVVIITGGSSGIGAATAVLFAKERANVAIVGRNETKLNKVAEKCEQHGVTVLIIIADIANDDEAKTVVDKTVKRFGKLDVLVNNAGIINFGTLLEGNILQMYDNITKVNLRAAIHLTMLAAPHLVKSKGTVINVSSVLSSSHFGIPKYAPYCIPKAGLDNFTRGAALELGTHGVRVNAVNPGLTRTELLDNSKIDTTWDALKGVFKTDRILEAEEVGDMIVYLASDKAKSINGRCIVIDNGCLLRV